MRRLIIYYLQDKSAVIENHVRTLLTELSKYSADIIMLCTEFPKLEEFADLPVNMMFRAWSGRGKQEVFIEGLRDIGWDKLLEYDEIVYLSDSIFGPLGEIDTWFQYIETTYVDFWGLTENFAGQNENQKYVPLDFIAIRKNVIHSGTFQRWVTNYVFEGDDCCTDLQYSKHLSSVLIQWGYQYDTWIHLKGVDKSYGMPMIEIPDKLVKEYRLPFFVKEAFSTNYKRILQFCDGKGARRLYDYLCDIKFDTRGLWKTLCRTVNQADWYNSMHLNYILSGTQEECSEEDIPVALMMHLYYMDVLDIALKYASNMPHHCDIYITTDSEIKKKIIEEKFCKLLCNKLLVIVVQNRGRSESGFCIGLKPYIQSYKYICYFHDKKTTQTSPGSMGYDFWMKCLDNIMLSKAYVKNVIGLFEKNPSLGLVMGMPPMHGFYYPTHGVYGWGDNYENVKGLLEELRVEVPMDKNKEPLAPLGSMFWFRSEALKTLWEKDWKYEDFPSEPNPNDGTLLHAIERSYSFIAQGAGYCSAYISTEEYAALDMTTLSFYLAEINKKIYQKGYFNDLQSALSVLDNV